MPLAPVCAAACWYCSAYRCARCCAGCGHPANCCACFGWRSGCGFCCRAASRYPSGSRVMRLPSARQPPRCRRSRCPRNSRRRLCRVRQAVPPCPAAPLTFGYCWQQSGPPGLWFYWCARQLAIAACAAWWPLPAKHRMLLHLRRGCHAVHTWRAALPHLYAAKPAGSPTPCGTAA